MLTFSDRNFLPKQAALKSQIGRQLTATRREFQMNCSFFRYNLLDLAAFYFLIEFSNR